MADERKIGISIPTFNRAEMTIESFINVYDDTRVKTICIVDDASDEDVYEKLKSITSSLPKVKLYRNEFNRDCYRNKASAMGLVDCVWAILLDSDNSISKDYLDKIYEIPFWYEDIIYTPSFAKPHFDFRNYSGLILSKENVSSFVDSPMLEVCLNAANYFVNTQSYVDVWDAYVDPVTSDSIFQCYNWLMAGKKIRIVDGLEYLHSVHQGSHYQNNVARTPNGFHEKLLNKLRQLK